MFSANTCSERFFAIFSPLFQNLTEKLTDNGKSFNFGYDTTSGEYGYYKTEGGADTFCPFSVLNATKAIMVGCYTDPDTPSKQSHAVVDILNGIYSPPESYYSEMISNRSDTSITVKAGMRLMGSTRSGTPVCYFGEKLQQDTTITTALSGWFTYVFIVWY